MYIPYLPDPQRRVPQVPEGKFTEEPIKTQYGYHIIVSPPLPSLLLPSRVFYTPWTDVTSRTQMVQARK